MADERSQPRFADLAAELLELANSSPELLGARFKQLSVRQQAEIALQLPAKQRLELMLHSSRPMRVVRALPDAELYMTVRGVGPADASPLLGLASATQLIHLIDLESWRGDRFDAKRAGAWVALFLEASEQTLIRFLRNADEPFLALVLQRWAQIKQIEYEDSPGAHGHGEGEGETDEGYLTPEGYHRFSPLIPEHAPAIRGVMQVFYRDQQPRYEQAMWTALWELPSDLEEQALHWRQSRLEEHGFPRWDEAISVYAPPAGLRDVPEPLPPLDPDGLAAPRGPLRQLRGHGALAPAIENLALADRERALHQVVSLANHLLVAEHADTGDPEAHRYAIEQAGGYIEIALAARGVVDARAGATLVQELPLIELFREGYAQAVELQDRARGVAGVGHEWLDSPVRERVLALAEPRPFYVELSSDAQGPKLRPFRSLAELEETRIALEMAELCTSLFVDRLGLDLALAARTGEALSGTPPRYSTFLMTLLAWHATRDQLRSDPLPVDVTADFLRMVASRRTAAPEAPGRAFAGLERRLMTEIALQPREQAVLVAFGRFCLEQLAAECGSLDPGVPPDPRAISILLLESHSPDGVE